MSNFIHGQVLKGEILGRIVVEARLGEGTQGTVYRVSTSQGKFALKWYHHDFATSAQLAAIQSLIRNGQPEETECFSWPVDTVIGSPNLGFGYVMPLIDTARFSELGQIQSGARVRPSYNVMCEITRNIAGAFRQLHAKGYCYRDINKGNVLFDSATGEIRICDNDNVGINRASECSVVGTFEFMPPELVLGTAKPSTQTDCHMLAVWLFYLWMWHHPLHGEMEYKLRSWDLNAKRHIYGERPLFIFDPNDSSNCLPQDSDYESVAQRWSPLPYSLRSLFIEAFTTGLSDPDRRVVVSRWQRLALRLQDTMIQCVCRAECLWDIGTATPTCWHCKKKAAPPLYAEFQHEPELCVTLNPNRRVLGRHLPRTNIAQESIIAEVVQNPKNPEVWGLRNLSKLEWTAVFPDSSTKVVPPGSAVPLQVGIAIQLGGTEVKVYN